MILKLCQYILWQNDEKPIKWYDYIYTIFCWGIVVFWEYFFYKISFNLRGVYAIFSIFLFIFAINFLFTGIVLKVKKDNFGINFVYIAFLGLFLARKNILNKEV